MNDYLSPRDTLALEISGTKAFPDRARLLKFVRQVTGTTRKGAERLLDQVVVGVNAALRETADYGRDHPDATAFVERMVATLRVGLDRLAS